MRANSTIRLLAISRVEVAKSSIIQSIRCSTRVSPLSKPDLSQAGAHLDHGACGCCIYQRIKRGLYAPPTSLDRQRW